MNVQWCMSSHHSVTNIYYVELAAASQVFWTQFTLYLLLVTRNGCFTIYITFTSYSSSVQAYTFQIRYPRFFALNKDGNIYQR